ncbi:MAG: hypothetical protein GY853_14650, partial [PVC group bacterium]|nr:hypothetical protein [PVC group bacterium]
SINEQRISEGLEPIEGGDEPRIAGRPISEPAEEKPVEAKPEDEEPKEEEDSEDDNKEKSADPFFSGSRAKFWNENVKALDKGTKSLHKALKLFIDEYSKTINKGLKKQSAKILKTNHVWNPAKKDDDGKPIYFDIDDIVPEKQFLQDLYLYVVPMMEDVTTLGILAAEKLGKVDVTDYEFEQFTKSVMKESLEKIVTIHGTMKDDLTRQLLTGRINTQYEIFTAANKYYDDFGGWKAERIARTTSTQINNHSAYEVYKSHNIRRQWITERDKRVRPSHKKLDGTYADKNGNYEYVDESGKSQGKTKYPGGGEKAGEVINCRCIMRPRPK